MWQRYSTVHVMHYTTHQKLPPSDCVELLESTQDIHGYVLCGLFWQMQGHVALVNHDAVSKCHNGIMDNGMFGSTNTYILFQALCASSFDKTVRRRAQLHGLPSQLGPTLLYFRKPSFHLC